MEPITGALYAAESLLSSAVGLAKGLTHPTLPLKANLTHITSVPVSRTGHTISVVKGRAYIFGGENARGELAGNEMQVIILPSSGVLEADYTSIPARAAKLETGEDGEVPPPRTGHSAVVVGNDILVFGGEKINENGRVWIYSTISNTWSSLDPTPGTLAPASRSSHAAAASELPGPKDIVYVEKAPQHPADPAKAVPEPADEGTWGTLFVAGGKNTDTGAWLDEALAFDLRTRTWSLLPSLPSAATIGARIALAGTKMYLFGGQAPQGATVYCLDLTPVFKHAEGGTTPLTLPTSTGATNPAGWGWHELLLPHSETGAPAPRAFPGLETVTTGQGREYLLLIGGEAQGQTGANVPLDDIWAFQLPSENGPSGAKAKDHIRGLMHRDTHEAQWAEAQYHYVDATGEEVKQEGVARRGCGVRTGFAVARGTEVDGATAVVWGGVDESGNVLGDGWLVSMDR